MSGPTKPAIVFGERVVSYDELDERTGRVQAVLRASGAGPGDRVAAMLPNGVEFFEVGIGAARAGCHVVPINWHLKSEEVAWLLEDSAAKVLVVDSSLLETARQATTASPEAGLLVVGGEGATSYEKALDAVLPASGTLIPPHYVYYTSGTTGRPRGVERDGPLPDTARMHAGLAAMWGISRDDVWMACSPLYHAANAYAYTTLAQGGTVVLLERWDATEWMRLVERHGVTACFMVPAHFIRLLELPPEERARRDLTSLRLIVHAAAPCPVPVKWQILEALPSAEIWEFYGATEGGATRISPAEWQAHPGSVGKPWPGVEIRILDDQGHQCPPRHPGLVYIRPAGGSSFRYRNDVDKTERAWQDGAFTVGDVGYLDEEGYLYLTDRASDMVIRGGVNIYPAEIEAVLHRHPLVVDCTVFGVADDRLGEELKALVETRGSVEPKAIIEHCRQHLADFKVPRYVEIVDTLPRDPSGKVLKRHLR
ncbi:MAG: AMP-binding protein [Actinomycetota bacterium]|nr:AMP-binding protein [Actinomycetota bacterium]